MSNTSTNTQNPKKHGPKCREFNGVKIFEYLDCTDGQRYFYTGVLLLMKCTVMWMVLKSY